MAHAGSRQRPLGPLQRRRQWRAIPVLLLAALRGRERQLALYIVRSGDAQLRGSFCQIGRGCVWMVESGVEWSGMVFGGRERVEVECGRSESVS